MGQAGSSHGHHGGATSVDGRRSTAGSGESKEIMKLFLNIIIEMTCVF